MLEGTNKKDGFLALARRKPERYRVYREDLHRCQSEGQKEVMPFPHWNTLELLGEIEALLRSTPQPLRPASCSAVRPVDRSAEGSRGTATSATASNLRMMVSSTSGQGSR
ncbi:MAG: hypothetical protein QE485_11405 [Acidovorax sp.]|uniref:hypothetical protein n=2 Tax=unclassified Acidovorax TaxID=2684926 RepID=UPI00261D7959|nr:hypothetical protein [Acidovorax sp.]MDH4417821.1 hypothetical protein [Acidovorax sp.]